MSRAWIVFVLIACAHIASATAQSLTREQIAARLAAEKVLTPGEGFADIKLGASWQTLRRRWGAPEALQESGVLRKQYKIIYRMDDNTLAAFGGDDNVRTITLSGNHLSLVRTLRGIRFGEHKGVVRNMFGTPSRARGDEEQLHYPAHGVDFFFARGVLRKVMIYSRR